MNRHAPDPFCRLCDGYGSKDHAHLAIDLCECTEPGMPTWTDENRPFAEQSLDCSPPRPVKWGWIIGGVAAVVVVAWVIAR